MKRVLLSWSSGKDSAWALYVLRQRPDVAVVGLLTTFNESNHRVAMHAVRQELVEAQAKTARLPLWPIFLPYPCSNEEYERRMGTALERARQDRITHIAFGDLFLEDIRAYRERMMAGSGIQPLFPLWRGLAETRSLAEEMLANGLRAVVTTVDPKHLPESWVGRCYDWQFLAELPEAVDPCGERGEFHTFCFAGPMFDYSLAVQVGATVVQDGFVFADLLGKAASLLPAARRCSLHRER